MRPISPATANSDVISDLGLLSDSADASSDESDTSREESPILIEAEALDHASHPSVNRVSFFEDSEPSHASPVVHVISDDDTTDDESLYLTQPSATFSSQG